MMNVSYEHIIFENYLTRNYKRCIILKEICGDDIWRAQGTTNDRPLKEFNRDNPIYNVNIKYNWYDW